jgi:nicotinamide mononucleotide transporter
MFHLATLVQNWLTAHATLFEWSAAVLTAVSVLLATREHVWNWPIGIVSVVMYAAIYLRSGLYSDATLQVIYFLLSIYGWYAWLRGGMNRKELHISRATTRQWYWCVLVGMVFWYVDATAARAFSGVSFPYIDAGTTTVSLIAQWMLTRKILENWLLWIVVNVIYLPMLALKHLYPTLLLDALLLALALKGLNDWRQSYRYRLEPVTPQG